MYPSFLREWRAVALQHCQQWITVIVICRRQKNDRRHYYGSSNYIKAEVVISSSSKRNRQRFTVVLSRAREIALSLASTPNTSYDPSVQINVWRALRIHTQVLGFVDHDDGQQRHFHFPLVTHSLCRLQRLLKQLRQIDSLVGMLRVSKAFQSLQARPCHPADVCYLAVLNWPSFNHEWAERCEMMSLNLFSTGGIVRIRTAMQSLYLNFQPIYVMEHHTRPYIYPP